MAKKTFIKDNPALQFISAAGSEAPEIQSSTPHPTPENHPTSSSTPAGYKINPMYVELKSKRLQLVLQPSLLARVKEQAREQGLSVNEFVHRILDEATKRGE